jgi:hypothetical protein
VRDVSKPPRRYGRLACTLFVALRWIGTHLLPGRRLVARSLSGARLEGTEVEVAVPGLPDALDGLRLVQLSDLHAGPWLDEGALEAVRDLVLAIRPDVLVITGDFITDSVDDLSLLGIFFQRLPARLGRFAVLGNHDSRQRREPELVAALRRQGLTVLQDASATVERGGARLRLVGLKDIEEGKGADLDRALGSARDDDGATVLLCHHPDVISSLPPGRFDLVLCGHTHGGQVRLPGGAVDRPSGRCRAGTHALPGGGTLHVNQGLGALILPLRVGAPAQVSCLVLRPASGSAGG